MNDIKRWQKRLGIVYISQRILKSDNAGLPLRMETKSSVDRYERVTVAIPRFDFCII